jgi:ABC-type sugar transport system ATPase subunit
MEKFIYVCSAQPKVLQFFRLCFSFGPPKIFSEAPPLTMVKTIRGFKLSVTEGSFNDSQIIVMLGENGTGKTTFIRMLV